jgi:hypothetical protein
MGLWQVLENQDKPNPASEYVRQVEPYSSHRSRSSTECNEKKEEESDLKNTGPEKE